MKKLTAIATMCFMALSMLVVFASPTVATDSNHDPEGYITVDGNTATASSFANLNGETVTFASYRKDCDADDYCEPQTLVDHVTIENFDMSETPSIEVELPECGNAQLDLVIGPVIENLSSPDNLYGDRKIDYRHANGRKPCNPGNSGAEISISPVCDSVTITSSKDISYVSVDGDKDEDITVAYYTFTQAELVGVSEIEVKSGTTTETFGPDDWLVSDCDEDVEAIAPVVERSEECGVKNKVVLPNDTDKIDYEISPNQLVVTAFIIGEGQFEYSSSWKVSPDGKVATWTIAPTDLEATPCFPVEPTALNVVQSNQCDMVGSVLIVDDANITESLNGAVIDFDGMSSKTYRGAGEYNFTYAANEGFALLGSSAETVDIAASADCPEPDVSFGEVCHDSGDGVAFDVRASSADTGERLPIDVVVVGTDGDVRNVDPDGFQAFDGETVLVYEQDGDALYRVGVVDEACNDGTPTDEPTPSDPPKPVCADVGATDIPFGSDLYDPTLDGDNDGVACESNPVFDTVVNTPDCSEPIDVDGDGIADLCNEDIGVINTGRTGELARTGPTLLAPMLLAGLLLLGAGGWVLRRR